MNDRNLVLERVGGVFAVARFAVDEALPSWVDFASDDFVSITKTLDEISIVASESVIAKSATAERGYGMLRVQGVLDFAMVGVLAKLTTILSDANIAVFVMSTFDTDYLLIKEESLESAVAAFENASISIVLQSD